MGDFGFLRISADLTHFIGICLVVFQLFGQRLVNSLSMKSQLLYCIVFWFRYMDIFYFEQVTYNYWFKILFLCTSSASTLALAGARWFPDKMFFKDDYRNDLDTFVVSFVLIPSLVLGYFFSEDNYMLDVMWTFSIFLEAFSLLPQYVLFYRTPDTKPPAKLTKVAVLCLGAYRALYLLNWTLNYLEDPDEFLAFHFISVMGGVLNLVFFLDFVLSLLTDKSLMKQMVNQIDDRVNEIADTIYIPLEFMSGSGPRGEGYDRVDSCDTLDDADFAADDDLSLDVDD